VKSEGNGQLRRVRRWQEYNIKTDTGYVEWGGCGLCDSGIEPPGYMKRSEFIDQLRNC
jgi:hypothetical protein